MGVAAGPGVARPALLIAAWLTLAIGTSEARERRGSRLFHVVTRAARAEPSTIRETIHTRGNRVASAPLVGGRAIGGELHRLIRSARHEVFLQFFTFETNTWLARQVRDAVAALPRSVPVYLLVSLKPRVMGGASAAQARAELEAFFADRPNVRIGLYPAGLASRSILHTKAAVVDNARALVMDMNVEHLADPREEGGHGWFQLGLRVEGPIAGAMRADAVTAWRRAHREVTLPAAPPPAGEHSAGKPMTFLARDAGAPDHSSGNAGILALFGGARKKIRVITPNLNDASALGALAAATAHADVEILLSKGFNERWVSMPFQGGSNARNVARLARRAADPSRLQVRWFVPEGGSAPVDGNGPDACHAKWASADGRVMILGSQNLDTQSFDYSREAGVAIDDSDTTAAFDRVHAAIWARSEVAFDGRAMPRPGREPALAWVQRLAFAVTGR